jgi:hypothetical protein
MSGKDDRRKDRGVVINTSFLLSVIILLTSAYSTYVITNLSSKIDKNFDLILECQEKYTEIKETVMTHLTWHDTIKEIKENYKKTNRSRK